MTEKVFLQTLSGKCLKRPPMWLMRQAGRYLPEYREVRAQAGSFLDLVYDPEKASEVTLQPIRRFGFDAAILFSDILVIPQALGVDLSFTEGEGPRLSPVMDAVAVSSLRKSGWEGRWQPVLETLKRTRQKLESEGFDGTALIGFAGSPWTLACYMVQGDAKDHDFIAVRQMAYADPVLFSALIDLLTECTIAYLVDQIRAGAESVQLFDSWAGVCSPDLFTRYIILPTRRIVEVLRHEFPGIPVIGFPRGAVAQMSSYVTQTGVSAVSLDTSVPTNWARRVLSPLGVLQGNLDPACLLAGGEAMELAVERILSDFSGTPHIFNLGHGILPATPIEHVEQLVRLVRGS